jgi:hypothetical protein
MRLVLVYIALFIAPAGALLISHRYMSGVEGAFDQEGISYVRTLNSILDFNPESVRRVREAPAILQLRTVLASGRSVAQTVCGAGYSPYSRLFDGLTGRCRLWALARWARRTAVLSLGLSFALLAVVLASRNTVRTYVAVQRRPGPLTRWLLKSGTGLMIFVHAAVCVAAYALTLQAFTEKTSYTIAIVAIPFILLYWFERRRVRAFVEPETLFPPRRRSRRRREAVRAASAGSF